MKRAERPLHPLRRTEDTDRAPEDDALAFEWQELVVGFDGRTGALEMGVHGVLSKKLELRLQSPKETREISHKRQRNKDLRCKRPSDPETKIVEPVVGG